ncbi:MAG: RDD family protein [Ignavibacteriae bacterium]|nr:RDD family protein [Ignavibacteriota bacterium]
MENPDLYIDEKGTLAVPLVDADAGKRFLNLIIDIGVVIFLIVVFNKILYHHSIFSYLGMFKILDIAVVFAYFYGLENSLGQTVGKMITKTKVVTLDGGKPTTQQMLVRTFSRVIPLEPVLLIGGKWLHDSLSQTRVVNQ